VNWLGVLAGRKIYQAPKKRKRAIPAVDSKEMLLFNPTIHACFF